MEQYFSVLGCSSSHGSRPRWNVCVERESFPWRIWVARPATTESVLVCVVADVLIAGLLARPGASHAILVVGELGLLRLVIPEAAVGEVRLTLVSKLPEAAPLVDEFLRAGSGQIYRPTPHDRERARELADA